MNDNGYGLWFLVVFNSALRRRLGVEAAAGLPPDTLGGYLGKESRR